jgi:isopenicillin N synthase-like dioxygenase
LHIISHRYKAAGANATDEHGSLDTVEFINVAKDDAVAWPKQARCDYPSTVSAQMESTIVPFVHKSLEVNNTLLNIFNDKLSLPNGALLRRHALDEHSGSEARCIKTAPFPEANTPVKAIGAHTDFGSLVRVFSGLIAHVCNSDHFQSFLHNRLGGLQVLVPGTDSWQYVKVTRSYSHCESAS